MKLATVMPTVLGYAWTAKRREARTTVVVVLLTREGAEELVRIVSRLVEDDWGGVGEAIACRSKADDALQSWPSEPSGLIVLSEATEFLLKRSPAHHHAFDQRSQCQWQPRTRVRSCKR